MKPTYAWGEFLGFGGEIPCISDLKSMGYRVFHIFSEGKETDFIGFLRKNNVILHLNEDSRSGFLHLVYADAILISPSGFSANAAAMGNERCYCPIEYRYYEKDIKWIYLNNNGEIVTDNTRK